MVLQATGSQPLNSAIHGLLCQAWHLSCSVATAQNLTVSYKLVSAKPLMQFQPRLPILDAAVHHNALWLQHQGPLLKLKASSVLGEWYEKHLPSNTRGGQIRSEPNCLQFQLHDVESPFAGLRKLRQRRWCLACGRPSWDLAQTSSFLEPARMGRSTSLRRRPAYPQEKTELHDSADEPFADGGQETLAAGKTDSKESELTSANEVDILDQPNKVLTEKNVQLEARLAAFQKAGTLDELTVAELKGIMKLRNRPTKGRKQDLLQQLERMLSEPADLGDAQKQLEDPEQMVTPHNSIITERKRGRGNVKPSRGKEASEMVSQEEMVTKQQRQIGNATVPGEDSEVGSVIKVYRSRRARAQESDTKADVAGDSKLPVKRTKIAKSGESHVTVVVAEKIAVKAIWATFNHKRPQPGWYAYDPSTMRPEPPADRSTFHKLVSWNVNGVRALLKGKDPKTHDAVIFKDLAEVEDFDILCLQETKLQEKDVDKVKQCLLPEFGGSYWSCSTAKLGYSGTAIISRVKPLSVNYGLGVADHDKEGRLITAEYDTFYLVTSYVPNSGDGLKRLDYRITGWDPALSSHVKELEKKKPVILTGDLNCCHQEMDIADPNANRRSAGFTDEERASFEECYLKNGLVDTFRRQHPNAVGYTYWGYRTGARARNHGWRLDYFLASEALCDRLYDSYSMPHVHGSDHCPIGLILRA